MEPVIIALGSNIGDRQQWLTKAKTFLLSISANQSIHTSSIYISEAIGPSSRPFFNAVAKVSIPHQDPEDLLEEIKNFERSHGRDREAERWAARTIDLDIIAWNDLVIQSDNLIIPHPEYHKRLFVLLPLQEIDPNWVDPKTGTSIDSMIKQAPQIHLHQTEIEW